MLNDKLLQFVDIDLHEMKVLAQSSVNIESVEFTPGIVYGVNMITFVQDARKRFDKATLLYDQVILL